MNIQGYLAQRQALSLHNKEILSLKRIEEFYTSNESKVYIAFSGGIDSTVLLHLVRQIDPSIPAVFANTGLEYPETVQFVRSFKNVIEVRPKKSFKEVIDTYGYPVISKDVAMAISRYRNSKNQEVKEYRLFGTKKGIKCGKVGVIPKKYHYLVNAPFKISDRCCDVLKKNPLHQYEKQTGNRPYIGTMASDSNRRKIEYIKQGCNSFSKGKEKSTPLGFWLREDIIQYIQKYNIPINPVYNMGENHTGCIFCLFGYHMEKHPTRFERMAIHHPDLYNYCMEKLNLKTILNEMNF